MVTYSATDRPSFTALTSRSFFLSDIESSSELCMAGVDYGDEEESVGCNPARDKAMLKSDHRRIRQPLVEKDV